MNLKHIPTMIADSNVITYMAIPIFREPKRDMPIALITKAELGLLQKQRMRETSFSSSLPCSQSDTAVRAPTGNPHRVPRIKADAACSLRAKSGRKTGDRSLPRYLEAPRDIISSEMTIKGKSDGITVLAQIYRAFFTESIAASEYFITKINASTEKKATNIACGFTEAFFEVMCSSPSS